MRLIDADVLKAHYAWWGDTESGKEQKELFDEIVDLQPIVGATQWISVKDRLPDNEQEVIAMAITYRNGIERERATVCTRYDEEYGFTFFSNNPYFVTHWMPLPAIKED